MFFDDSKKAATIIAGRRNEKGERTMSPTPMKAEIVKEEDGQIDGRHVAAQEMMAAMHEKSPQKLMEALSSFMDIHHSSKNAMVDKE